MDQILMFVGASSDTWDYAKTYLRIVCVSGLFVLIANCYSSVIRAEGQSGKAMMGQLLGSLFHETGLIWAQPVADVLSLVLAAVLYFRKIGSMGRSRIEICPTKILYDRRFDFWKKITALFS